jgi:hypothetical protein
MTGIEGDYYHRQKGPWWLLLYILTVAFVTAGWYSPVPALQITFLVTGLFMFLLGLSFHHLTVADEGSQLAIHFGPFPLFRKRIWYDDIIDAEKGRTTFLDGWGISLCSDGGRLACTSTCTSTGRIQARAGFPPITTSKRCKSCCSLFAMH